MTKATESSESLGKPSLSSRGIDEKPRAKKPQRPERPKRAASRWSSRPDQEKPTKIRRLTDIETRWSHHPLFVGYDPRNQCGSNQRTPSPPRGVMPQSPAPEWLHCVQADPPTLGQRN